METQRQITVFLENKPGRLLNLCNALAKEKVNLQALSVMDTNENSVLRMVCDRPEAAVPVLQRLNMPYTESDVCVVELKNQSGAIANLCERLAAEHVNIDYVYCSTGKKNGTTVAILKASPVDKVRAALAAKPAAKATRAPTRRPPARRAP